MVAWEFVDVFKVFAFEGDAPRLVKVIDEATATKRVLNEIVKRTERVRTHLRYFNIVSVGRYDLNWRKGLQFSKSTGAVLLALSSSLVRQKPFPEG